MASHPPQDERLECPQHPDAILVEDYRAGDMICPMCGVVIGDRVVDVGSEWRTFTGDFSMKDRSRVGTAGSDFKCGGDLTSVMEITYSHKDKYAKWALNSSNAGALDKGLRTGLQAISNMSDRICLPKMIVEQAQSIFHQVYILKSIRGRTYDAVAAACLLIACRQEGVPRCYEEISGISGCNKKDIGRCVKHIQLVLPQNAQSGSIVPVNGPETFMSRYCSILDLPTRVGSIAAHIAQCVVQRDFAPGRVYLSIYATAIYIAAIVTGNPKSLKEVHDAVGGVAEGTIKLVYRQIYPHREEILPESVDCRDGILRLHQI